MVSKQLQNMLCRSIRLSTFITHTVLYRDRTAQQSNSPATRHDRLWRCFWVSDYNSTTGSHQDWNNYNYYQHFIIYLAHPEIYYTDNIRIHDHHSHLYWSRTSRGIKQHNLQHGYNIQRLYIMLTNKSFKCTL